MIHTFWTGFGWLINNDKKSMSKGGEEGPKAGEGK
jgi:hypothetical protein